MTTARRFLRPSTSVATSIFLPALVCLFTLASNAAAQAAPPTPASIISTSQAPPAKMNLDVSNAHPVLRPNVASAFDFCTGQEIPIKGKFSVSKGLKLDTAQGQCGIQSGQNIKVTGGNPPYHFQLDTMGGFPPIGMHLGMNGLLYGTPTAKPPLGGWKEFAVCAVDMSGNSDCPKVQVESPPVPPHHGANGKVLAVAVIGAVAIGGVAAVATIVEFWFKRQLRGSSSKPSGCLLYRFNICLQCRFSSVQHLVSMYGICRWFQRRTGILCPLGECSWHRGCSPFNGNRYRCGFR